MASAELFRVFVAIYRSGSVSGAARARHLTQPAVSAQLATLETRVGERLFTRTPRGMTPTERGQRLYAHVADAVDRLENAARALRVAAPAPIRPLRLGCSAEFLHGHVLARLHGLNMSISVTLGPSRELQAQVETGELDAALTAMAPPGRALSERPLVEMPYVLIGPPDWSAPQQQELGSWLNARPWVSSCVELPVTRRFFLQVLGARFTAPQALVAPDLRAVVRAVELGLGATLTPLFAATEALAAGRVQELLDCRLLLPPERWRLIFRVADEERVELRALAAALQGEVWSPGGAVDRVQERETVSWREAEAPGRHQSTNPRQGKDLLAGCGRS